MNQTELIRHGHGQMRAQSFSVQVSTRNKCNGGCLFCISRLTPGDETPDNPGDLQFCDENRLRVGLNYARSLGATHAILTSKADPTQEDPDYLCRLASVSREYLPLVDMHTNGFLLLPGKPKAQLLKRLVDSGLTMLTLSIASFDADTNRTLMILRQSGADLVALAKELGLLVRCSLVVNKLGAGNFHSVWDYIHKAGELGAHMVVVREVWRPEIYADFDPGVAGWNHENWVDIAPIQEEFVRHAESRSMGLQLRDPLPWGTPVFAMGGVFTAKNHGVNITFARCDEATTGSVIKSIVHRPNGHGYRNWDHDGDILY